MLTNVIDAEQKKSLEEISIPPAAYSEDDIQDIASVDSVVARDTYKYMLVLRCKQRSGIKPQYDE